MTLPCPTPSSATATTSPTSSRSAETATGGTSQTPAGVALGKKGNGSASAGQEDGAHARHLRQLRQAMQSLTDSDRYRGCGVRPVAGASEVTIEHAGKGVARFGALQSCRSVWVCPTCAAGIALTRAAELERAVTAHAEQGGGVVLLTLTVAHCKTDALGAVWGLVRTAWSALTSDKAWKGAHGIRKRYGVTLPPAWGHENTVGEHGWHPHRHVLLFVDAPLGNDALDALQAEIYSLWRRKVTNLGAKAPHPVHGVDVRQTVAGDPEAAKKMAAYVAKGAIAGIAAEVTQGQFKQGREGNRTPMQILADIHAARAAGHDPDAQDVALWLEYVAHVTDQTEYQLWFPPTLKKALGIDQVTDAEALEAAEEADDIEEPTAVVAIPRDEFRRKLAHNLPLREEVLSHIARARRSRKAGLLAIEILTRYGIEHRPLHIKLTRAGDTGHSDADPLPTHTEATARELRKHVLTGN